jgi:hypothetical protein
MPNSDFLHFELSRSGAVCQRRQHFSPSVVSATLPSLYAQQCFFVPFFLYCLYLVTQPTTTMLVSTGLFDAVWWMKVDHRNWVLWDVAPCSHVEVDRRFRGAYCFHHRRDDGGSTQLWNVRPLKRDYSRRRVQTSYSPQWEPEISRKLN